MEFVFALILLIICLSGVVLSALAGLLIYTGMTFRELVIWVKNLNLGGN